MRALTRAFSAGSFLVLFHGAVAAQSLITAEEFRQEQVALAKEGPRSFYKALPVPGAPRIEVQAPNTQASLIAPFEIRIKLVAENGAQIVPESFKVLYGAMGFDITSRVMKLAEVNNDVIRIGNANIPAGKHRLTLRIRDNQQRETQTELAVVVQDKKE